MTPAKPRVTDALLTAAFVTALFIHKKNHMPMNSADVSFMFIDFTMFKSWGGAFCESDRRRWRISRALKVGQNAGCWSFARS